MMKKAETFEVECPRCTHVWFITPSKWQNINSVLRTGRKIIYCPNCNKKLRLSEELTEEMMTARTESFRLREVEVRVKRAKAKSKNRAKR